MIPTTRPVQGQDLDDLRRKLGLAAGDACWLYGMSMTKWTQTVKNAPLVPLRSPTLSIYVRMLDAHLDANPLPVHPEAADVFAAMKKNSPLLDKKRMALLFGCEASSGYRWLTVGTRISPVLARLFLLFMDIYQPAAEKSEKKAKAFIGEWESVVEAEAMARGIPNLWRGGRWTPNRTRKKSAEQSAAGRAGRGKGKSA